MAVTRAGTAIRVTADNDKIAGIVRVKSILYVPGASGQSAVVRVNSNASDGPIAWQTAGGTANRAELFEACFVVVEGLHIDLAGSGTEIIIYTE